METSTFTLFVLLASSAVVSSVPQNTGGDTVRVRAVTPPGIHTECPVWYAGRRGLLFVDIAAQRLQFYNPGNGAVRSITFNDAVAPIRVLQGDELVVGVGRQVRLLNWAASNFSSLVPLLEPTRVLAEVDADKPGNRLNDGNVDRRGRIWFGTMGPEPVVGEVQPDQAALYRITARTKTLPHLVKPIVFPIDDEVGPSGLEVTKMLSPVSISNGLVWNDDETVMYYIDTPTRRVDAFDYDAARGLIANRRPAFDFAANNVTGNPDGMTIDSDGNLWVACFGGSQVIHVDPRSGRLLRRVAIPASQVTAVELGEPVTAVDADPADGRRRYGHTLYVTTMRKGLSEETLAGQPLAGSVFAVSGLGAYGGWIRRVRIKQP